MRPRPGANEWPLVFFTVLTQAAAGTAAAGVAIGETSRTLPLVSLALLAAGSVAATMHLGRPAAARFALANLRTSWLSRETSLATLFGATLVLAALAPSLAFVPAIPGLLLVAAVAKLYMIRTVPAWNSWATPASFFATAVILGATTVAVVLVYSAGLDDGTRVRWLGVTAAAAAGAQILIAWVQRTATPEPYRLAHTRRLLFLALGAAMVLGASWPARTSFGPGELAVAGGTVLLAEVFGRYLFYASHRRLGL